MANFNKVYLMGNLTRDPELKYTQGGMAIVEFGMAMNRKYKKQNGEMVEETTFVDIEGFGRQAETFNQYMRKGPPRVRRGSPEVRHLVEQRPKAQQAARGHGELPVHRRPQRRCAARVVRQSLQ